MSRMVKLGIKNLFRNNYLVYIFVIIFLLMGVIFGVMGVKALTDQQFNALSTYVDFGLANIDENVDNQTITRYAVVRNLQTVLKIWFLGLTVIGLPLILVIIFTRGFVLGFTVGFFLENKSWQGLGLIVITILPQNIVHLPAMVIAGVSAISFSLYLLNGGRRETEPLANYFIRYSILMVLLAVLMICAGFIEGYISPLVAKILRV